MQKIASKKELIVFDLDGTLVVSKSQIDQSMTGLFVELLKQKKVAVISGGSFAQFRKSFVDTLQCQISNTRHPTSDISRLSIFPTCGAAYYRYEKAHGWQPIYQELLSVGEKQNIRDAFEAVFAVVDYEHPKVIYGAAPLEDRGSQMAFSPLGQSAPVEAKEAWRAENEPVRLRMRAELEKRLEGFEVRCGGLTTIDVTRKGIDKAYGIKKMEEHLGIPREAILFIGDKLEPGGNDYPVKAAGVDCLAVANPEETKQIIRSIVGA